MKPPSTSTGYLDATVIRQMLVIGVIGAVATVAWLLSDVLVLVFGAVVVALGFGALATRLSKATGIPRSLALATCITALIVLAGAGLWLFGIEAVRQFQQLGTELPAAARKLWPGVDVASYEDMLKGTRWGDIVAGALAWGVSIIGAAGALALVLGGGIFLAMEPERYRNGLLALVPDREVEAVADTLDRCATALRHWFGGQLIAMVLVGAMTAIGLYALGMPSFLGLGLIAGITEFIPFIGPFAGAVPAVLIAASTDWRLAGWVILLFVAIQQIENNLILPAVMGQAVNIAPVVGIFGTVATGILLGPLGLIFGYPLVIVANVAVQRLYIEGVLGRHTDSQSD